VQAGFLGSAEFRARAVTGYSQALYLTVLHRPGGGGEEVAGWDAALPVLGPTAVAAAFTASAENRANAAAGFLHDLLNRPPQPGEAGALAAQPGDLLALEAAVLAGDEFYARG
jgi:hypothetical protein